LDLLRRLWRALLFDRTRADRLALGVVFALTMADAVDGSLALSRTRHVGPREFVRDV